MNKSNTMSLSGAAPCVISVHLMHPQMYDMAFGACAHYSIYLPALEDQEYQRLKKQWGLDRSIQEHHGYNMVNLSRVNETLCENTTNQIAWDRIDPNIEDMMLWCVDAQSVDHSIVDPQGVNGISIFGQIDTRIMDEEGRLGVPFGTQMQQRVQAYWKQLLLMEHVSEMPLAWYEQKGVLSAQQSHWFGTQSEVFYAPLEEHFKTTAYPLEQLSHSYAHFEKTLVLPVLDVLLSEPIKKVIQQMGVTVRSVGGRVYWSESFCHTVQQSCIGSREFVQKQQSLWEQQQLLQCTPKGSERPKIKGL